MERRVLLAIFLAFLVLYVWQAVFVKPVPKPGGHDRGPERDHHDARSPVAGSEAAQTAPANAEKPAPAAPAAPASAPLVAASAEQDVRVETREVVAVFTNRGARSRAGA
jgi:YidC/Oxa1 family membrane protein insertase